MNERAARAVAADRCPLCGEANDCALAAGCAARCWCTDASFTAAVRERAADAGGAMRCVCARCARRAAAVEDTTAAAAISAPR